MGVVYKAHDTKLKRDIALKFLPQYLTSDQTEKERFYHEAQAASALNHQNVTTIYEISEFENPATAGRQLYIAMEYVEGKTLKQLVEHDILPIKKILDISIQVCDGLSAAHDKGIVHRDIKSENIMLAPKGQVKIMDFGLAKVKGATKLTKEGSTLGTAAYMSPEQAQGEEVDHRSDIFSFGVVLYELLTGKLPFRGEHHAALMYSIINEEPQPIARFNEQATPEIERMVSKALAKDKDERYQHSDELLADLRHERKKLDYAKAGYVTVAAAQSITPKPKRRWMSIVLGIIAIGLIAVVVIFLFYPELILIPSTDKSIAVLPFKNMSDSKEDEYFSDGLTEDIITQLSKISGIKKVIGRTSVMQYKGGNKSIHDIGKELGVTTVLEGSVRRSGNQVRIVAQLIDASNEGHLWAETYDKEMTQIFAIQSDVAQRIATALKAKLSPEEKERIAKKQTDNTEAYQLYLKGRFHWNKRTLANHRTAIEYFTQAIEKDSLYALAYAGLASTYVLLPEYTVPVKEALPKAETAARKALDLDPTLAEPHSVIGTIKIYEWDWADAETEFKKAIELDPNSPTAHQWYSRYFISLGRNEEALAEDKYAQELDPLSLIINMCVGMDFLYMKQFDRALDQLQKTLDLDPNFPWAYLYLGECYEQQGKFDMAITAYKRAIISAGISLEVLADMGYTYAKAGRKEEAVKVLRELLQYSEQGNSVSWEIAVVYNGLGDKENAFRWLERAADEHNYGCILLKTDRFWDNVRSDPRFIALLKKMGLEK
jgi:serine/threonine-protein kinase